jgi:uncharacterized protein (TIRG00374 family)
MQQRNRIVSFRWKLWVQWAVALALILFLLAQISLQTLIDLFSRVNVWGVFLGGVVYMLTNVIRALRVAWICDRPMSDTGPLLVPTLASSFGNNVLPARAGEPIFVWAAHQRLGLSWGASSAVMVIMRVFDTMLVAIIFVLAAVLTGLAASSLILTVVAVGLSMAVVVTALLPWLGGFFVELLVRLVRLSHRPALVSFIEREGQRAADAFRQLRAPRIYAGVFLTSLVIWVLVFFWIYLLVRSLNIPVTLDQSIVGSTFGILSKAVPFSSIGGWGAHEVGWAAGFTLIGFPSALAIGSGFAVNTLIILTSAVCGLPAWLSLSDVQRQGNAQSAAQEGLAPRAPVQAAPQAAAPSPLAVDTLPVGQPPRHSPVRLFAQICALNEQETLAQVIRAIPRSIPGVAAVQVLVVDDGSTDQTAAVALQAGADHVVRHNCNKGLARAFQSGLDACIAQGADIIVNIDADGQYDGADIPALIAPILAQRADIVVGDRQVYTLAHFSPSKRMLERMGSAVVQMASGTHVADAVSGFRAYSREAALRLFVTSVFSYTVQTLIQAGKLGLAVASVPIHAHFTPRPSRLHRGILHFINQQASILIRTYVTYEPLKTFGMAATPFLLVGLGLLIRLIAIAAENDGQLVGHVQSLVAGSISLVIGLLLVMTGITADRIRENRRLLEEIMYRTRAQAATAQTANASSHSDLPHA